MKLLLCFLTFTFYSVYSFSQEAVNFKEIKFRHQNYKGLDMGFFLNDDANNRQNTGSGNDRKQNAAGFNGSLNYFSLVNADSKQWITKSSARTSGQLTNSYLGKSSGTYQQMYFNSVLKNYTGDEKFHGMEINFSDYYGQNKNHSITNTNTLNSSVLLTLGKGRAEYISDGITSYRLFEELRAKHLLLKEPSTENILEFSKIIIAYNNRRVLDSRLNTIEMIEAMVNYLQDHQLIASGNALSFAILNDQVYLASPTTRYCGLVKQWGTGASFHLQSGMNKSDSTRSGYRSYELGQRLEYSITKYQPLDLKNQLNTGMSLGLYYSFNSSANFLDEDSMVSHTSSKSQEPQLKASLFIERGYYPNTRTAITWLNRLEMGAISYVYPANTGRFTFASALISSLNLYYYISPQFRLSLSDYLSSSNNIGISGSTKPVSNSHVRNSFNISLNYAFF